MYDEPLMAYFDIGGPCRLHVKNRLVCLDEVQPLPQRDWHKVKDQLDREEREERIAHNARIARQAYKKGKRSRRKRR